jgi:56kDa selenium binding protein (SBP56)
VAARTGYVSPHTVHCGPNGILISALGSPNGGGPGEVFVMDHEFDVLGKRKLDRIAVVVTGLCVTGLKYFLRGVRVMPTKKFRARERSRSCFQLVRII